ncbi:cellulose biosynthesis protein [Bordetella ansorpii]|uniref:Cellulose biosynthesis protein n=1 Tax=Bordetella ansorpii TaxID=288768 RepID=A0A157KBJ8_9BORD|nr:cellulose biosynthesis protein BcsP [Bordetella ansorpii]SAH81319.1 cellulose biosynthesis protein [Bordetella ansorpii]
MSDATDISSLYRRFGGDPEQYLEVGQTNQAQASRDRWPLLSAIRPELAMLPPSVGARTDLPAAGSPWPSSTPASASPDVSIPPVAQAIAPGSVQVEPPPVYVEVPPVVVAPAVAPAPTPWDAQQPVGAPVTAPAPSSWNAEPAVAEPVSWENPPAMAPAPASWDAPPAFAAPAETPVQAAPMYAPVPPPEPDNVFAASPPAAPQPDFGAAFMMPVAAPSADPMPQPAVFTFTPEPAPVAAQPEPVVQSSAESAPGAAGESLKNVFARLASGSFSTNK